MESQFRYRDREQLLYITTNNLKKNLRLWRFPSPSIVKVGSGVLSSNPWRQQQQNLSQGIGVLYARPFAFWAWNQSLSARDTQRSSDSSKMQSMEGRMWVQRLSYDAKALPDMFIFVPCDYLNREIHSYKMDPLWNPNLLDEPIMLFKSIRVLRSKVQANTA